MVVRGDVHGSRDFIDLRQLKRIIRSIMTIENNGEAIYQADKNPFPRLDLLPGLSTLKKIGRAIGSCLVPFHCEAPSYMSTHNRGGGPALDRALYEQGELDYGPEQSQV